MRSRQKILDSTIDLIERVGFEGVSIAAIAQSAGVSRQTVYSNFGSREEVVSQAMAGVAVGVLSDLDTRLQSVDTACEFVVEFIVGGRAAMRAHPVLATLLLAERGNPVFDTEMMERAHPVARGFLRPLTERGLIAVADLDAVVEISVRLGLSVIVFDSDTIRSDEDLRTFLTRWLQPALAHISV